jgi:hypothetical protein
MFVQVIQGHVADGTQLKAQQDRWVAELAPGAPGWLGCTAGVTADGLALVLARFSSGDAARRNSERPEQHQWWMETAKLFAGDVTFHDCAEVRLLGGGGSDDAGFVQVIQGHCTDVTRAYELMDRTEPMLRESRPEVLGGEICLHGNTGDFTQAMYFTSEAEARDGERQEPAPDVRSLFEELMSLMDGVAYFDLTDPWIVSPRQESP